MDRDSGVIDLFAIHKEEEQRVAPAASPSGPPPAVSFDTHGDDSDVDDMAFAQAASRKRAKIIGGAVGGLAVVGILCAAIFAGGSATKDPQANAAAAQPPAAAETVLPPAAAAPPPVATTPVPAPPSTAKADDNGAYSRAAAIAAVSKTKKAAAKSMPKSSGVKMQKIQSSGTN